MTMIYITPQTVVQICGVIFFLQKSASHMVILNSLLAKI